MKIHLPFVKSYGPVAPEEESRFSESRQIATGQTLQDQKLWETDFHKSARGKLFTVTAFRAATGRKTFRG